ncbi:DUF349 domain-containing protein [Longispora fulva]|uniref:DUF349 domain-containing protein n=1 Tax=Longispora fulva TaxID=619741 RepID=A0A8J7KH47_9ACTN|nr:DUF349 domain-containing protein [Longispora fulva]MBG6138075.1 hypothetical protein [Longispora fulva]
MSSDWATFGRVDADGTVYVKTAAGERAVGSWQAGTPEEGLAHFVRRFEDLQTEVVLLEKRLASGAADPQQSLASIKRLKESVDGAHAVGDLDSLAARLEKLTGAAEERAGAARQAKEAAKAEALTRKQTLVGEAELIATESTQWKVAGDRLKEILDEWKTIKGVDRKADTELWKRYAAARDGFTRRRGAHFATLDQQRKSVQSQKEELVVEAESLSSSEDWNATANRLKELMAAWKETGRASKDTEQKLWDRFRAAQDAFFSRRSEVFSARDAEFKDNLTAKQALLAEAEAIDVEADPKSAQGILNDLQGRWHDVGRVPRENMASLDRRWRGVEEKIKLAMDTAWRRTAPEDNPLLAQMRVQVAEAEERLAKAQAAGDAKRIKQAEQALAGKQQFLKLAEGAK